MGNICAVVTTVTGLRLCERRGFDYLSEWPISFSRRTVLASELLDNTPVVITLEP
jgi:hypothetical protein